MQAQRAQAAASSHRPTGARLCHCCRSSATLDDSGGKNSRAPSEGQQGNKRNNQNKLTLNSSTRRARGLTHTHTHTHCLRARRPVRPNSIEQMDSFVCTRARSLSRAPTADLHFRCQPANRPRYTHTHARAHTQTHESSISIESSQATLPNSIHCSLSLSPFLSALIFLQPEMEPANRASKFPIGSSPIGSPNTWSPCNPADWLPFNRASCAASGVGQLEREGRGLVRLNSLEATHSTATYPLASHPKQPT